MKTLILTFLTFSSLLFLMDCDDNSYNGGNYNEQAQNHNYSPSAGNGAGGVQSPDSNNSQVVDVREEEIRDFWQKPKVIIEKMGNLEGKVVADIGAGPYGYFTVRIANKEVKKVIAMDIDREAIQFIEISKISQDEEVRNRIETRLVEPDDAKLKPEEADIVLIVNTYVYFEDPVAYLRNLKKGISKDGKVIIIDFKKRTTPEGPPLSFRAAIGEVEQILIEAGYTNIQLDDQSLNYQYIIVAQPGLKD